MLDGVSNSLVGKKAHPRVYTKRGMGQFIRKDYPGGEWYAKEFRAMLRKLDSACELLFHALSSRWCIYRMKKRGSCPYEDEMVLQWVLEGADGQYREPGMWLFWELRRRDAWAIGQKEAAGERDALLAADEINDKKASREIAEEFGKDAVMCMNGRHSIINPGVK